MNYDERAYVTEAKPNKPYHIELASKVMTETAGMGWNEQIEFIQELVYLLNQQREESIKRNLGGIEELKTITQQIEKGNEVLKRILQPNEPMRG